jgi:hypothetical protein
MRPTQANEQTRRKETNTMTGPPTGRTQPETAEAAFKQDRARQRMWGQKKKSKEKSQWKETSMDGWWFERK